MQTRGCTVYTAEVSGHPSLSYYHGPGLRRSLVKKYNVHTNRYVARPVYGQAFCFPL